MPASGSSSGSSSGNAGIRECRNLKKTYTLNFINIAFNQLYNYMFYSI